MPKKAGFTPVNISVSQNFLTSKQTIQRLLRLTDIDKSDHVLEIGPGKGHITKELLKTGGRVSAVELDAGLHEKLEQALGHEENLRLYRGDFLRHPLPNTPYKVFANIPFSITTKIVEKLFLAGNPPQEAWLVMEKGAAKRFLGRPSERRASLCLKPFFDMEVVYHFRREDFHPRPGVDAVLLHFAKKQVPDIQPFERNAYLSFIDSAFKYGPQRLLTKKQASTALKKQGLPPIPPSALLLYVQWLCLFRCGFLRGEDKR